MKLIFALSPLFLTHPAGRSLFFLFMDIIKKFFFLVFQVYRKCEYISISTVDEQNTWVLLKRKTFSNRRRRNEVNLRIESTVFNRGIILSG